jgi:beta-phosphoglucomutase-like phosphatase (HAD superfamily)
VLTQTAKVHAAVWKEMFDDYLRRHAEQTNTAFLAFDPVGDYDAYVDGKPRADGTRSFLESRGIELPEGAPDDPPDADTVQGLGIRKNEIVLSMIHTDAGLERAVVSSSASCRDVLVAAGIEDLFETRIDGLVAERDYLRGKPAPDTFLAGARALGVEPSQAAVFEDAPAGVEAGRAGRFGLVVGVDRMGQADALRDRGADVVVNDLSELLEHR